MILDDPGDVDELVTNKVDANIGGYRAATRSPLAPKSLLKPHMVMSASLWRLWKREAPASSLREKICDP